MISVSNSLELFCPSMGDHSEAVITWQDTRSKPFLIDIDASSVGESAGFLHKCQRAFERSEATVLGYLHSDLFIHERNWDQRVLHEFDDPTVGVVGFVGAKRLGYEHIYKIPYSHTQLARYDVLSNLTDAETHGARFTGTCDVAVVDSCAVFMRRDLLRQASGWPVGTYPNNAHCSDLWACLVARRLGLRTRLVGVACTHRSGGKGEAGSRWLEQHGTDIVHHRRAHELIYEEFRDQLPVRVA